MMTRPRPIFFVFGLLGSVLAVNLVLPIANLVIQADWPAWAASSREHGTNAALGTSAFTSTIAVTLMILFGVPLGFLLARGRVRFKRLWISLVFLPMVVPDLAGGILLLQTFGPYGTIGRLLSVLNVTVTNNLAGIVLAQVFVSAPFVIISALAGFAGVDSRLEMAAATLGDSEWQVFWRISLPLAWPSIAAGVTLAWIRALGEFGATLVVAYNPHTLPVYTWVQFESNGLTGALPIAFMLVLLAAAAVTASMFLSRLTGYDDVALPSPAARRAA